MISDLKTPFQSPSLLNFLISSSNSKRRLFHASLINKNHFVAPFSPTHPLNPLQESRNITKPTAIKIHCKNQEVEENCSKLKLIRSKKLLSELSTWRIGGPCNFFIQVSDQTQLVFAIRYCYVHSLQFIIVGKGSNCLFDDDGFDGCVILNQIDFLQKVKPGIYRVGSGYPFNRLGVQTSIEGFTGLEFASGIPGTVGGAVYMNAGANGQETADVIESVEVVTVDGSLQLLDRNDLNFGYRVSPFQDMEDLAAITGVTFRLTPSRSAREQQEAFMARRRLTQPLGERNAGSVFRNPRSSGVSAGELIEKAGLKGFRVGGAKVSEIHANFFINFSSSTSQDMLQLIELVKKKVDQKFGVQLKEEIKYVHPHSNGFNPNEKK